MSDLVRTIVNARATDPGIVTRRIAERRRPVPLGERERVFLIAADHPARGVLKAGSDSLAMADRADLLRRLEVALGRPGVDGVLASADIVDDLAIRGALDERLVFGTMNRGGLAGSIFELDDAFTGYSAVRLASARLDGGKMMVRISDDDPGTLRTLVACARAVDELAAFGLTAMIEVFATRRDAVGRLTNDLSTPAMQRAIAIASGLGGDSSHTWLKLPVTDDTARMLAATTLPVVLLGGDPGKDAAATVTRWQEAMALPQARGLVAGRALLYPEDGDVAGAVDRAAAVVRG